MASTSGIANLSSYYQSLIKYTLEQEKKPLTTLTTRKDDVKVKKSVYEDLKTKFESLNTAIKSLISTDLTYAVKSGRAVTVTSLDNESTVAAATVGNTVGTGTYKLVVDKLAKAHEVRGVQQTYSDQDLSLTGNFIIGGAETRSAAIAVSGSAVASVQSNNSSYIAGGKKEFGTGSYYIETRQSDEVWQFRIVDSEGVAQDIQETGSNDFTSNWQDITASSTYDTGRGMKITFGAGGFTPTNMSTGAVRLDYTAKGHAVDVTSDMSLVEIATKINEGTYGDGNEVSAAIINKTLVLTNLHTGAGHVMAAADVTGSVLETLGIKSSGVLNTTVTALDASFSVNNIAMTRSSNSGLTDVVSGMTLSLASDAEGKTANIVVNSNNANTSATINTFLATMNDLTSYLRAKTSTTKNADDTYTRGALVGESGLRYLSSELITTVNSDQTNTGVFQNLEEIGITFTSELSLTVSDTSKLSNALQNNISDVTKLLDVTMKSLSDKISTYVGTTGYINKSIESVSNTMESYDSRITSMKERLTRRESSLVEQYAQIQAQMQELNNQYTLNNSLYG